MAALLGAVMVSLTSCELPEAGTHHADYRTFGTCKALDDHYREEDDVFGSLTWRHADGACAGVAAQLVFKGTDGELYQNQWNWATNVADAPQSNAVASPVSRHRHCSASGSCGDFEN
ncbi:hypothetical protein KSP35_20585 [Aquihabitans sp. G128]|uniref:hypothetical protein n=1 Tax=Aquihabitans sp. G128 TaxID=2849779 RepID=UPI001C2246DE|nr:hypothetical protein [Aquihabitans sp. G128]QXC60690.1 hypothetical protein KSP35_20585 [Aquihabitans sp. G128]